MFPKLVLNRQMRSSRKKFLQGRFRLQRLRRSKVRPKLVKVDQLGCQIPRLQKVLVVMLLTILVKLRLMVVLMVQTEPRETELQFLHLTVLVKMVGLMMHPMLMMLKKMVAQLKKLEQDWDVYLVRRFRHPDMLVVLTRVKTIHLKKGELVILLEKLKLDKVEKVVRFENSCPNLMVQKMLLQQMDLLMVPLVHPLILG